MALEMAVVALVAAAGGAAERPALMPWPSSIEMGAGELTVGPDFRLAVAGRGGPIVEGAVRRFEARLARQTGLVLPSPVAPAEKPTLEVRCDGPGKALPHLGMDESYTLSVTPGGATLQAAEPWGCCAGWRRSCSWSGPARPRPSACPPSSSGTNRASRGAA